MEKFEFVGNACAFESVKVVKESDGTERTETLLYIPFGSDKVAFGYTLTAVGDAIDKLAERDAQGKIVYRTSTGAKKNRYFRIGLVKCSGAVVDTIEDENGDTLIVRVDTMVRTEDTLTKRFFG